MFSGNSYYDQVIAAQAIPQFVEELKAAIPGISEATLAGINFNFLGINLGTIPQFNIFSETWVWNWAHIGAFLIPVISAASQVLQMWISQKTNNSVVTNEKGIQDEETAKKSQQADHDVDDAPDEPVDRLQRVCRPVPVLVHGRRGPDDHRPHHDQPLPQDLRCRGCRPAPESPGGGPAGGSKKKLQKQQRDQEQAAKAAAAKEYAARKGILEEDEEDSSCMSGIPSRPYCKGRNYDPNRYASQPTEE